MNDGDDFVLYRAWDFQEKLLYVGRTMNPPARLRAHRLGSGWWLRTVSITLARYSTLEDLIEAERRAIKNEHPIFNVVGDSTRRRIEAVSREIDSVYGTRPGTSLRAVYGIYWPPEQCSGREFKIVLAMAKRDLRAARRIVAGIPIDEAFERLDPENYR